MTDEAYLSELRSKLGDRLLDAVNTEKHPKNESYSLIKQLKDEIKAAFPKKTKLAARRSASTSIFCASRFSASR